MVWNRFGKFNAQKVRIDGILFDSKAESKYYLGLKLLIIAGEISDLEVHPRIPLEISGKLACVYEPDFRYIDTKTGKTVYIDVKGHPTPEFKLKYKLLQILRPEIDIRVIKA